MDDTLTRLDARIAGLGLACAAASIREADDGVPTLADGSPPARSSWSAMSAQASGSGCGPRRKPSGPDPIDRWTARVLAGLADAVLFPFGGPPHHPFQRWARRADPLLAASPLGILIHPEFGLWHALRGAPAVPRAAGAAGGASQRQALARPALAKPCLTTCPVEPSAHGGYDVTTCRTYLRTLSGQPCMIQGCQARLACPVGRAYAYRGGLAQHHMRAFARG